jgi:hypothetical protein
VRYHRRGVYLALKEGLDVTGDRTYNDEGKLDTAALDQMTLQQVGGGEDLGCVADQKLLATNYCCLAYPPLLQFVDECKGAAKHINNVLSVGSVAFRGVSELKSGKFLMSICNPHERRPNGKMKLVTSPHDTAEEAAGEYDEHAIRFRGR